MFTHRAIFETHNHKAHSNLCTAITRVYIANSKSTILCEIKHTYSQPPLPAHDMFWIYSQFKHSFTRFTRALLLLITLSPINVWNAHHKAHSNLCTAITRVCIANSKSTILCEIKHTYSQPPLPAHDMFWNTHSLGLHAHFYCWLRCHQLT